MRRAYKKPYSLPSHVKHRKKESKHTAPLVQPAWDDTIHDLTALKASPDDVVRRKLARTSRNQMGMALLSQSRSAHSGQQERYTPGTAENNYSDAETGSSCSEERAFSHNQQQHLSQQASRQQQQAQSSASKLARYACSAADSEDDVCQWQSPSRPAPQRPVLQDICNSNHAGRGAEGTAAHKMPAATSQKEQQQLREQQQQQHRQRWQQQSRHQQHGSGTLTVDADMMQVLLDKISLLEQQLQRQGGQQIGEGLQDAPHVTSSAELQQQLICSQQQLAATQQELRTLQDEHRQYVAHTSTLITQLQTQMQQLLSSGQVLSQQPQPLQQQQQQQRPPPLYSSPTAVQAGRLQPPALRGQLFAAEGAAAGGSSSSRLQHISNYIQQELHELQPRAAAGSGSTAAAFHTTWSAGLTPAAAVGVSMGSSRSASSPSRHCVPPAANTGMPSPAQSPAQRVAASAAASSPARSSPARRKAETHFTAAVTDTVALPSYSAMRQRGKAVRFCATGDTQVGGSQDPNSSRALAEHLSAAGSSEGGNKGIARSGSSSAAPIGSPRRLHTSPVPQPLSADATRISQAQQQLQQPQATLNSSGGAAGGVAGVLPLNVPPARGAAVWEPELSSPRPQQLQVPEEVVHYPLSKAAAECVAERLAAPAQLGSDLTALLRDLGLASLELEGGSFAQQDVGPSRSSSGLPIVSTASQAGAAAAAGVSVPVVLSEAVAAPSAALAPSLLSSIRGDGVLAGPQDVDWGVQEGLPLAAVGRVYTAAGRGYGQGEAAATRPVLAEGLRGNMCLKDHLWAAAAHAASK